MKIIIPMAGLGTRFQKVADTNPEYKKPKPFINVMGYPMVRWATGSLPFIEHPGQKVNSKLRAAPSDLTFVILKEHDDAFGLEKGLREIYSNEINVVKLDAVTRGAAETAYAAKDFVNMEDELIITDSDHYFSGNYLEELLLNKDSDTAGVIPVFTPPADGIARWSYSLLKNNSNIIEQVGEKDPELMKKGAPANIGAYCFTKAKTFFTEVEEVIMENKLTGDEGKKEFYIAPMYQNLIEKGYKFQAAIIPQVWGLGTPSDLENFIKECPVKNP